MNAWKSRLHTEEKQFVILNCDESNVNVDVQKGCGVLVRPPQNRNIFYTQETTSTRGSFSVLTFIASDAEVQRVLPQFIVVSKKLLNKQSYEQICTSCEPGTYVWRLDSSWLDASVFIACLKIVSRSLQTLRPRFNFVLLLDCASIHMADEVVRASRLLRLPLVFVPRNTTWLLQPCDTHVFRRFKSLLRRLHTRDITRRRCLRISLADCCRNAVRAIQMLIVRRDWRIAFLSNGFLDNQRSLSARIRRVLQSDCLETISDVMPPADVVRSTLPRRRKVLTDLLVKPLPETPSPALSSERARVHSSAERPRYPVGRPLYSRSPSQTRSVSPTSADGSTCPGSPTSISFTRASNTDWSGRLRGRDENNAAICGSKVKQAEKCKSTSGGASSSKDPWTPRR